MHSLLHIQYIGVLSSLGLILAWQVFFVFVRATYYLTVMAFSILSEPIVLPLACLEPRWASTMECASDLDILRWFHRNRPEEWPAQSSSSQITVTSSFPASLLLFWGKPSADCIFSTGTCVMLYSSYLHRTVLSSFSLPAGGFQATVQHNKVALQHQWEDQHWPFF